jgi:hypothetical protein
MHTSLSPATLAKPCMSILWQSFKAEIQLTIVSSHLICFKYDGPICFWQFGTLRYYIHSNQTAYFVPLTISIPRSLILLLMDGTNMSVSTYRMYGISKPFAALSCSPVLSLFNLSLKVNFC